ncbi:hypothetical protein BKA81DRAFT_30097 [Phyllosticta paracitricarpa]
MFLSSNTLTSQRSNDNVVPPSPLCQDACQGLENRRGRERRSTSDEKLIRRRRPCQGILLLHLQVPESPCHRQISRGRRRRPAGRLLDLRDRRHLAGRRRLADHLLDLRGHRRLADRRRRRLADHLLNLRGHRRLAGHLRGLQDRRPYLPFLHREELLQLHRQVLLLLGHHLHLLPLLHLLLQNLLRLLRRHYRHRRVA